MTAVTAHNIRQADKADLAAINHVIESAVMSWQLPERVKRLSLPSYYYDEADLLHLSLLVAEDAAAGIIAVTAWEEAGKGDLPLNTHGLLLHGLYVLPVFHGRGLGRELLHRTEQHALSEGYNGVLVKAQADSIGFFQHLGYERLPVEDSVRHYLHRLWKVVGGGMR